MRRPPRRPESVTGIAPVRWRKPMRPEDGVRSRIIRIDARVAPVARERRPRQPAERNHRCDGARECGHRCVQ
jgi:hypothetical protein